jgi:CMP/dCMP kinase
MEKVIIVSGFAGSGKSTLADSLSQELGLRCIHASDLLKQLKEKQAGELDTAKTVGGKGWWESKEAEEYMKKRLEDESMDRKLDELLLQEIEKGKVVLDSWTMPWLSKKGFKIWLSASPETRAKRISGRDFLPEKEVAEKIKKRDAETAAIYKKIYGFELGKDFSPFNLILETDSLSEKQVFEKVLKEVKKNFAE